MHHLAMEWIRSLRNRQPLDDAFGLAEIQIRKLLKFEFDIDPH